LSGLGFVDAKLLPYGRGRRDRDAAVTKGAMRTHGDAVAAVKASDFGACRDFRVAVFGELNDGSRTVKNTESIAFAFFSVNTQKSHTQILPVLGGLSPENLVI